MQVGMKKQVLSPGVKHGEEADLGAQMFGIGSDGRQGLGRSSEQDAVDQILVLVSEGSDVFGQCKNHVEVWAVQDFGFSFFDPLCRSEGLTWGNDDRGSYRSKAVRRDSCRSVRDDRRGLPCDTPRSRS